jgi:hypothetical protein
MIKVNEVIEACAREVEAMRPAGGRAWDETQSACFSALTDAAAAIRALAAKYEGCIVAEDKAFYFSECQRFPLYRAKEAK